MLRLKRFYPALLATGLALFTVIMAVTSHAGVEQSPAGTISVSPDPQNNPVIKSLIPSNPLTSNPGSTLPDYRKESDPRLPVASQAENIATPLFGYSYFEPAQQLIAARRVYLKRLLAGQIDLSEKKPRNINAPDPANSLTDSQKVDLLLRYRDGKATDDEKTKYSKFLGIKQEDSQPLSTSETSSSVTDDQTTSGLNNTSGLDDAQKAQLLAKYQNGLLTDDEKAKYGTYLAKNKNIKSNAASSTDSKKMPADILEKIPGGGSQLPSLDAFSNLADPISQLFSNVSASAPANYQLSGGDSLTLRYWSPTMEAHELTLKVDPTGGITIPDLGRIIVRGQSMEQAEAAIRERMKRIYRNADVSLSLKELRTMPVTVSGESFYPGTYTVPAVVTALNMLYATGGPTTDGTLRKIEVRRRGSLVSTIDFYKFLITGDQTSDLPLQPGDVIYIPGRLNRVKVRGEVRRSAIYELTESENLKDVLLYAGGIKPSGVAQRIQVSTLHPGSERVLRDVDITDLKANSSLAVYDGDTVDIFSVRNTLVNKVTIEGPVDQPGEYAITPNMTVADLVERSRGMLSDAYPTVAHLYRYNPDNTLTMIPVNLEKALARDPASNLPLTRWDRLTVYTRQEVAWTGRREVTVRGAVKNQGIYYRSDNMRVSDLLMLAGGTLPNAYMDMAVLLHQKADGSYIYEYLSLAEALKSTSGQNTVVKDRDILAVYRVDEANFTPEHSVSIFGEVVSPGKFPRGEGMKLSDALHIAGGITPRAGDRILVGHSRTSLNAVPVNVPVSLVGDTPQNDLVLQDGDLITIQGKGDYQEKPYVVNVTGAVNRPGPVILHGKSSRLTDAIKEAGGLKPNAYPLGVEFIRDPSQLVTAGQTQLATVVSKLNDLLNSREYQRELAKSDVERMKVIGSIKSSSLPLSIPGISSSIPDISSSSLPSAGTSSLFSRDLVSAPRVLQADDIVPKGNVFVDMPAAIKKPGSQADMTLLDGDKINIPEAPTTVQVIGAVIHSRSIVYQENTPLSEYIAESGGYTSDAATDRILVIRMGGGLTPINKLKKLEPGDVILVPTKVLAAKLTSKQNDIDSIFRSLTNSALIVLVAKKLIGF